MSKTSVATLKLPTGAIEAKMGDLAIVVNADGYVDATLLCQGGGKQFGHWRNNKRTADFLDCLSTTIGIPILALLRVSTNESNGERHTWVHPKVAINMAQWISPQYDVFVSDVIERYHKGDLGLASEVVQQHDAIHNTTSTVTVSTVLGKRKAELELNEQEVRIRRMEAELLKDCIDILKPGENASEIERLRAESDIANVKAHFVRLVTGGGVPQLTDGRGSEISFALLEQKMGVRLTKNQRQLAGRKMAEFMKERYGQDYTIPKKKEYVDGRVIEVNAYWSRDEDLMKKAVEFVRN